MSWLSGLAGKAEALLDRMDQAAASSLQTSGLGSTPQRITPGPGPQKSEPPRLSYEPTAHPLPPPSSAVAGSGSSGPVGTSSAGLQLLSKPRAPSRSVVATDQSKGHPLRQPAPNDESLFEFLNSPIKQGGQSGGTRKATSRVSHSQTKVSHSKTKFQPRLQSQPHQPPSPMKLQPLTSVVNVGRDAGVPEEGEKEEEERTLESREQTDGTAEDIHGNEEASQPAEDHPDASTTPAQGSQPTLNLSSPKLSEEETGSTAQSVTTPTGETPPSELLALQQRISNLELENKLLKREVGSLNDELGVMLVRVRETGEGAGRYEKEIAALREQVAKGDHMIRQLRSHEEDLQSILEAKESQIQVLRTQLAEGDKNVEKFKLQISNSHKEKERLLQDANLSSGAHNHALDSLKAQLEQAQAQLEQERETSAALKTELSERESQLHLEQQQLSETLTSQRRQLAFQQARTAECQAALQTAHSETQLLRKEHEDYKQRATGILQVKERLIASLQGGAGGGVGAAQEARLEELQLEREHLQAQLQASQQHAHSLRADVQELEDRHGSEVEQLLEQVREAEAALAEERVVHEASRAEVTQLTQEVEGCREERARERDSMATQLREKETEIETLKSKLSAAMSVPGKEELESRFHDLTESLIQKQTVLEALSSEKSSLNVQLQRLKSQLSEARAQRPHLNRTHTAINGLEDVESESASTVIRPMASVLPSLDSAPAESRLHNVRNAMNTFDKFSIRLGVFLRRYPYARLFVLFYMVLLHLWVMVVLLTYTPEVHDMNNPKFTL